MTNYTIGHPLKKNYKKRRRRKKEAKIEKDVMMVVCGMSEEMKNNIVGLCTAVEEFLYTCYRKESITIVEYLHLSTFQNNIFTPVATQSPGPIYSHPSPSLHSRRWSSILKFAALMK